MQIVGYEVADPPRNRGTIAIASDGTVDRIALEPGRDLSYSLSDRHCAGTVDGQRHHRCDREASPYCDLHVDRWACARCTGDCTLPLSTCEEEHSIYLAAFAPDIVKVGVTRSWRLETRLREQGADRAAHVQTVENGRIARRIEADIAQEVGDSVRVDRKVQGLHRSVDDSAWTELLDAYDPIETFRFDAGLALSERPVAETIATGRVEGVKGRILLLTHRGSTYAVDLRDLVGYEVQHCRTDRPLQSTLAAFE